jgi:adenosylmethionine-8-amino-7-oxononanoate aminotransferase/SAM-dependent methyltransferase
MDPHGEYWGCFAELSRVPAVQKIGFYEGFYADLYNLTTQGHSADVDDYLQVARRSRAGILDVGCGTGRMLVQLAAAGHSVVGVDNAPDMLRHARRNAGALAPDVRNRVELTEQSALEFDLPRRFGSVIVSAFTFLLTPAERVDFFRRVERHLEPDGSFAFDFLSLDDDHVAALDGTVTCASVPARNGALMILMGTRFDEARTAWSWNFYVQHILQDGNVRQYLAKSAFARLSHAALESELAEAGLVVAERRESPHSVANLQGSRAFYRCVRRTAIGYPLWHPYLPMNDPARVLVLASGRGCRVTDRSGREYIDASGGLWSTQCGLGRPEIIDAISRQLETLSYGTLFALRSNQPAIALAGKLSALAGGSLTRVFLTCSGSEAVELAIKFSRLYFHLTGRPDRTGIAYLDASYHGTCYGSMGVTALYDQKERLGPHVPGLHAIRAPRAGDSVTEALACAADLDRLARTVPGGLAAFILEPVFGSAGVVVPPREYLAEVRRICDAHGIVLILDEVATGFGRTGRWFAYQHFDVRPDMLLLSKGINSGYLPLGAVVFKEYLAQTLLASGVGIGHGSSANGNPACCASALATIRILEDEDLIRRAETTGAYFQERLRHLCAHPAVRSVRGLGLMRAIELCQPNGGEAHPIEPATHAAIYQAVIQRGVLPYPFRSGFSFFPPLTIDYSEVDQIADAFERTLAEVDAAGRWRGSEPLRAVR